MSRNFLYSFARTVRIPLKEVLRRPPYLALMVIIALLLVAISSTIANYQVILNILLSDSSLDLKASFMAGILGGILTNNSILSLLMLTVTGLLAGANISMAVFKHRSKSSGNISLKSEGGVGGGMIAGLVGAGCSSCGVGILALLGIVGGISILPLGGLEIWAASTLILLWSMHALSREINSCDVCQARIGGN